MDMSYFYLVVILIRSYMLFMRKIRRKIAKCKGFSEIYLNVLCVN